MSQILSLPGRNALSEFRVAKLSAALAQAGLRGASITAEFHHLASLKRALSGAERAVLERAYEERLLNPYIAAERGYVDDVIDPSETRRKVVAGFRLLSTKREELPRRKHGNVPL